MASVIDLKTLISATECNNIIRKVLDSNKFEIIEYIIDGSNIEVMGFLGQYFRLSVKVKTENDEVKDLFFFLKSLPVDNQTFKNLIESYGFFQKETQIYKTIFSQMKKQSVDTKWHPNCYLVRDDIFVFDDLKFLGYDHISKKETFPENYMQSALISLARMHSSSLEMEQNVLLENETMNEKFKEIFFETLTEKNTWLMVGFKLMELLALKHPAYGKKYKEQIEKDLFKIMCRLFDKLEPSKKFKNVIAHRDLWGNNLMFKKSEFETSCMILDFQICRVCPPAFDFLLIVYFNSRQEDRVHSFKKYQEFYYSALVEESRRIGVNDERIPTHDEFLESCDFYKLVALVLPGVYVPITHFNTQYLADLQNNDPEKFHYVLNIDRSDVVFEQMEKDEYYRDYLYETVGELIEEYFIKKNI